MKNNNKKNSTVPIINGVMIFLWRKGLKGNKIHRGHYVTVTKIGLDTDEVAGKYSVEDNISLNLRTKIFCFEVQGRMRPIIDHALQQN